MAEEREERTEDGGQRTDGGPSASSFAPAAATEDKSCFAPAAATEDKGSGPSTGSGRAGTLEMIGVMEIRQSPNQTRQVEGTPELDAGIEELAQSIRENGLVEPLVVRRGMIEGGPGLHVELIAGHRRLAACKRAGLGVVPCYVRDVDGAAAADLTVIENLQRRDLTPIEEAAGVAQLLDLRKEQADRHEAVARSLGKSVRWVFRRASLGRLTDGWKAAAARHQLSAAYLEAVARLPAAVQAEVLAGIGEDCGVWARGGDMGVLQEEIEVSTRALSKAPWATCGTDKVCGGCPDRSDAQADLFEDMAGDPRCLNRVCYGKKVAEFVKAGLKQLKAKHPVVIETPTKSAYLYSEKKDAAHTVPVLVTEGSRAGSLLWAPSPAEKAGPLASSFAPTAATEDKGSGPSTSSGQASSGRGKKKQAGPSKEEIASKRYVQAVCAVIESSGPVWDPRYGQAVNTLALSAFAVGCGVNGLAVQSGTFEPPVKINRALAMMQEMNDDLSCSSVLWRAVRGNIIKELTLDGAEYYPGLFKERADLARRVKEALGLPDEMVDGFVAEFSEFAK